MEKLRLYRFIKHFQRPSKICNIRLVLRYTGPNDVFMARIALRTLLVDKNVILVPTIRSPHARSLQDGHAAVESQLESLNPCRMLRCRSITFETNLDLAWLIDEITSEKEVDLFPGRSKLGRLIHTLSSRTDSSPQSICFSRVPEHAMIIDKSQIAVLQMNMADATLYSARLLQQIFEWNDKTAKLKIIEARRQCEFEIAETERDKEKIRQQVEELHAEFSI